MTVVPSPFRLDRAFAEELDRDDPLCTFRDQFALPRASSGVPVTYMCGNSLGLMPREAAVLMQEELEDWAALGVEGHFRARRPWFSYHEGFRHSTARLVGARPSEVVVMNTLTTNLHLMMATFYQPRGARTRILVEDEVFPSDRYAVRSQAAWHGLDPDETVILAAPRAGEHTLRTEDIEGLLVERGEQIALVLLGAVNYFTGQWLDVFRITAAAREAGCIVGWDLAHAAGNVPLRLHDWDVDFAAWCTYKYLNAGPGAVAGAFVHERHGRNPELPRLAGWWGNDPDTRFAMHENMEFVPRTGADGWQISNPPIFSLTPLRASLDLFDAAGLEALRAKSIRLTGYLESLLGTLESEAFTVITPSDPDARGCQLSLQIAEGGNEPRRWFAALREADVVADFREPDVIRVAPTPLYNTFSEVWDLANVLRGVAGLESMPRTPLGD